MEDTAEAAVVEIPVTFRMSEEDHRRILATKQEVPMVATYMLSEYAAGGVMVKSTHAHYLERLSGRPVKTSETVVDIVESGVARKSAAGYLSVTYNVDPAFAEPLEQLAKQQGRTVEEIVQDGLDVVMKCGWLYNIQVDGGTINLTKDMRSRLEKAMKQKNVTGADIVTFIENLIKPVSKKLAEVRARMDHARLGSDVEVA
jgi:hypothetical protein